MSVFGRNVRRGPFLSGMALWILVLGLAVRLVLAPFLTYPFDIEHWAVIMQNTESGNGLYGLTGYFYTPIWGYMLGFQDLVLNTFFSIDYGERFTDLAGIEGLQFIFHTSTVTTPEYNLIIKLPLILVDLITGYLVFRMVLDRTGDQRKASIGFGLWFLCPLTIYMSAIQAQFDCVSAMLTLLCVLFLKNDRSFLAGIMFAVAALLKFFPAFCIFIFCIYLRRVNGDRSVGRRKLLSAAAGAFAAFVVIYAPQILDGTFVDSLSFIFGRASGFTVVGALRTYSIVAITFIVMAMLVKRMNRMGQEEARDSLILYTLTMLAVAALISSGPQYCIVYLPLLAYYVAVDRSRALGVCMVTVTTLSMLAALINNEFSLLETANEYYGLWNADALIDAMEAMDSGLLGA